MTEEEFNEARYSPKPRKAFKEIAQELNTMLAKATAIASQIKFFSFDQFDKLYYGPKRSVDVFGYYRDYMAQLKEEGRPGTMESYQTSMVSLQKFLKEKNKKSTVLPFENVTANWLKEYERYMVALPRSITTVGIYLRPLRALYNLAIEDGNASKEFYPFTKRRYQIPGGRKAKKALPKTSLKLLLNANTEMSPEQEKAQDLWFFSFACNGINLKDVLELKWNNIHNDRIVFTRAKTRLTTKGNLLEIVVFRNEYIDRILEKYCTSNRKREGYVFDILSEEMNAEEKRRIGKNLIRFINQHMRKLAEKQGITEKVSYNWARHSFTTKMMSEGASLEMLQECLGHQSKQTTQNYWGGFDDPTKKSFAANIMNFDS